LENIIISIKKNERCVEEGGFSDRSSAKEVTGVTGWIKIMHMYAERLGISLSQRMISAMQVPNTEASLSCFAWMNSFFDTVGDKEPDRLEIHLDAQPMRQIYNEYKEVMDNVSCVSIFKIIALTLMLFF
jgi:hypothetical protein